jgi:hypothetical protein
MCDGQTSLPPSNFQAVCRCCKSTHRSGRCADQWAAGASGDAHAAGAEAGIRRQSVTQAGAAKAGTGILASLLKGVPCIFARRPMIGGVYLSCSVLGDK